MTFESQKSGLGEGATRSSRKRYRPEASADSHASLIAAG